MRRWAGSVLCVLWMSACAARVSAPPASVPPALTGDPAAVYVAVRRHEESVRSIRARFSAVVYRTGEERRAEGVLLVKKPDRFRMRLLSPFGFTVFDYTSWGGHARMHLPLEGKELADDEIANQSAFSPADWRAAFLRADAAFPGECTPQAGAAETVVECRDAHGDLLREIRIETRTQAVSHEVSFAAGRPHLIAQFDDYRMVDTVLLPFAIELIYPERAVRMQIAVRGYEVNPQLADNLFDPPDVAGAGR
jgi:hypothetical protein